VGGKENKISVFSGDKTLGNKGESFNLPTENGKLWNFGICSWNQSKTLNEEEKVVGYKTNVCID